MKLTGRLQETGRHLQASRFRIQILATLPLLSISCKRQPEASDGKNWAWPNADRRNVVYGALLNGEAPKGILDGKAEDVQVIYSGTIREIRQNFVAPEGSVD
jgi:hypothetical protein